MKVFLELAYLPNNELVWYLMNIMEKGDVYSNGKTRYMKIPKGHNGKKWEVV